MPKPSLPANNKKAENEIFARLFVADEIRFENNGKPFVIGLYPDGVVIFNTPKNAPPISKEHPYGMPLLTIMVVIGGVAGKVDVRLTVANNKAIEHTVELKQGGSVNLHVPIRPFTFASFGVKDVLVEFAGTKHLLQFELRERRAGSATEVSTFAEVVSTPKRTKRTKHGVEDASIVPTVQRKRPRKGSAGPPA